MKNINSKKKIIKLRIKLESTYYYVLFFLLSILCIPNNFVFGLFNTMLKWIPVVFFPFCLFVFFSKKLYKKRFLLPFCVLLIWQTFSTVINFTGITGIVARNAKFFSAVIITTELFDKNPKKTTKNIATIFTLIMVVQYISFITHIFGYSYDQSIDNIYNYFLGIRVNINKIILFAFFFSIWNILLNPLSGTIKTVIVLFTGLSFVFGEHVSTSIIGVFIYAAVLLMFVFIRNKRMWHGVIILTVVSVVSFAFIRRTEYFERLLIDLLNESLTLNGRVDLWEQAINNLHGLKWIIGNGYENNYLFFLGNSFRTNLTHNQYLQYIFNYGFVGLALYVYMCYFQAHKATNKNEFVNANLIACLLSMLVIQVPATTDDMVYYYIFYAASMYINSVKLSD